MGCDDRMNRGLARPPAQATRTTPCNSSLETNDEPNQRAPQTGRFAARRRRVDQLRVIWRCRPHRETRSSAPGTTFNSETPKQGSVGWPTDAPRMVARAGVEAKLGFPAHPHMLRHACGFALANKGHDTRAFQAYLGQRNIQHTVRCQI